MSATTTATYRMDRRSWRPAVVLAGWLGACTALAQPAHTEHMHVPLDVDTTLDWDTVLAAAVAAHPARFELEARRRETGYWRDRANNILADAPVLGLSALSDRTLDDAGQSEFEISLDLPLWRLGEKRAAQSVAGVSATESAAARQALQLEAAGTLRSMLWEILLAEHAVDAAETTLALLDDVARAVQRRFENGDLPEADALLARGAQLEQQVAVLEAEARLLDAEREYRGYTGLGARPAAFGEPLTERDELYPEHPTLELADQAVATASAHADLVERELRGHPVLTIGPRRQRDPFTTQYNTSLNVGVSIPFGGRDHGAADRANAARRVGDAESRRSMLQRRLELELHEAEHTLAVVTESLELAEQQARIAERRLEMGRTAFELGEIELRELLRIQDAARGSIRAAGRLAIARQAAIASVNQALGELP